MIDHNFILIIVYLSACFTIGVILGYIIAVKIRIKKREIDRMRIHEKAHQENLHKVSDFRISFAMKKLGENYDNR